uniref:Biotin carboxyl carrier protein of acetyl-CoA carboxylaseic-like n=1 Tax=Rhizophora mucronata TaxID=61149 RepID=A0A2P2J986_RHIMU
MLQGRRTHHNNWRCRWRWRQGLLFSGLSVHKQVVSSSTPQYPLNQQACNEGQTCCYKILGVVEGWYAEPKRLKSLASRETKLE